MYGAVPKLCIHYFLAAIEQWSAAGPTMTQPYHTLGLFLGCGDNLFEAEIANESLLLEALERFEGRPALDTCAHFQGSVHHRVRIKLTQADWCI